MDHGPPAQANGLRGWLLGLSDTWYRSIFVPYAVSFLAYIAAGIMAALSAHRLGVSEDTLKFVIIPLIVGIGVVVFTSRQLWRSAVNSRARRRSLNQDVIVLSEINSLIFLPDDVVDLRFSFKIKAKISNLANFITIIYWNGDP